MIVRFVLKIREQCLKALCILVEMARHILQTWSGEITSVPTSSAKQTGFVGANDSSAARPTAWH